MKTWRFTTRWLLGSQFVARLLGLVNNVLLARLLAPAAFGDFTQAMAYAGALVPLADMGVSAVITRHTARRARSIAVLQTALGLRVVQSVLLWATVASSAWLVHDLRRLRVALLLAGTYWALACVQQLLAGIARARVMAHIEARAVLIERVATVLLAVLGAVWFGVTGALVGVVVGGVLALVYLLCRLALPRGRMHWSAWKRLLAIGAPLMVADVCHGLIMRLDILAVGMRYGAQHVGWYGSVSPLLWAGVLVPGSMALALVPAFAPQQGGDSSGGRRVLGWMLGTATLMALALSAGAGFWVGVLYGHAYAPAVEVLRWLAWGLVPAAVVAWGNAVLLIQHRTAWVGAVAVGGRVCLALCLWWWLPAHGLIGAAGAQVTAQCLMATALWLLARRSSVKLHPFSSVI